MATAELQTKQNFATEESALPQLELTPGRSYEPAEVCRIGRAGPLRLHFQKESVERMTDSHEALKELLARGEPVYGESTGFGPHVQYQVEAHEQTANHGLGLLSHLTAGAGEDAPRDVVRATIFLRATMMSRGHCGVRPETARAYGRLLESSFYPVVPVLGSVGASGDLVPLSYIARVVAGQGFVTDGRGTRRPAGAALSNTGPAVLRAREALAMTNGVSWSAAWACYALHENYRLMRYAEALTGWMYSILGSPRAALDARLHAVRGHGGQAQSARAIFEVARASQTGEDQDRPLQEPYSVRCAPQILGAARDQFDYARSLLRDEINGVSDNPMILRDDQGRAQVLHGGNFFGQQIAFASDAVNAAAVQTALLAERQIALLANPERNGGAPLLLAWRQGIDSGIAGVQIMATSVAAEMRTHSGSFAVSTIPTNGDNQDIVSMSSLAARAARKQADRLAIILAALHVSLARLNFMRGEGRAPGGQAPMPDCLPVARKFRDDMPLDEDIAKIAERFLGR